MCKRKIYRGDKKKNRKMEMPQDYERGGSSLTINIHTMIPSGEMRGEGPRTMSYNTRNY